jgi:hypothetical protein
MKYHTPSQMVEYIQNVEDIGKEIQRIKELLVGASKYPLPEKTAQDHNVGRLTEIFQALLTEKARQEIVKQVRENNASNTQNSSTSPANNTPRSIGIGNILKQKITRR